MCNQYLSRGRSPGGHLNFPHLWPGHSPPPGQRRNGGKLGLGCPPRNSSCGLFESPALALELEQVALVHQAVELRGDDDHVAQQLGPVLEPAAQQAIDYFVFRVRRELGAMIAVLSGLDAITFCGGIGENAVMIRDRILAGFEWIGIEIDDARNRAGALVISSERSRVKVFVVPTNEEAMIARHTLRLVGRHALVDR